MAKKNRYFVEKELSETYLESCKSPWNIYDAQQCGYIFKRYDISMKNMYTYFNNTSSMYLFLADDRFS